MVVAETTMEQTGQKVTIPCFVMSSAKPIWQGIVRDCAMVLGTNALVEFGLQLVHTDGSIVVLATIDSKGPAVTAAVSEVVLSHVTHLALGQTKQVEVTILIMNRQQLQMQRWELLHLLRQPWPAIHVTS